MSHKLKIFLVILIALTIATGVYSNKVNKKVKQ